MACVTTRRPETQTTTSKTAPRLMIGKPSTAKNNVSDGNPLHDFRMHWEPRFFNDRSSQSALLAAILWKVELETS